MLLDRVGKHVEIGTNDQHPGSRHARHAMFSNGRQKLSSRGNLEAEHHGQRRRDCFLTPGHGERVRQIADIVAGYKSGLSAVQQRRA